MMMTNETDLRNPNSQILHSQIDQLAQTLHQNVEKGLALHKIEAHLFEGLLNLGSTLMQTLFQLVGTGDMGTTLALPDGPTVHRLPHLHNKTYL